MPYFNAETLTKKITSKRLPLSEKELKYIRSFCLEKEDSENLRVLDGIPFLLRQDWLDEKLDEETRACGHSLYISPNDWQECLEDQCRKTVRAGINPLREEKILAILMWRAALAYAFPLIEFETQVQICHIEAKRNEKTLEITSPMPLNTMDEYFLRKHRYERVFVPDPMLASGNSNAFAVETLKELGVKTSEITILCVVAAPEGIFHLFNIYPDIKIIAVSLDVRLNENAYILPGLGDVGEKYFKGNSLSRFKEIRHTFTSEQWLHLGLLLQIANKT